MRLQVTCYTHAHIQRGGGGWYEACEEWRINLRKRLTSLSVGLSFVGLGDDLFCGYKSRNISFFVMVAAAVMCRFFLMFFVEQI